ncbi:sequestosome-1 [Anaeramoeba flamelloides]|uniref:Sequestosome-1 n=1 Tax=Anaeramoeba flamelloides TaxID=1746091 RepID=A0AAV8AJ56_9EUKA|nr:sequestosome-1 [Anaeramoeba flamelloides]
MSNTRIVKQETKIQIKSLFKQDFRRFKFPTRGGFNDLAQALENYYKIDVLKTDKYTIFYTDQAQEFITFSSDKELKEAIKNTLKQETALLRIFIASNPISTKKNQTEFSKLLKTPQLIPLPIPLFYHLVWSMGDSLPLILELITNKPIQEWIKTNQQLLVKSLIQLVEQGTSHSSSFVKLVKQLLSGYNFDPELHNKILNCAGTIGKRFVEMRYLAKHLNSFSFASFQKFQKMKKSNKNHKHQRQGNMQRNNPQMQNQDFNPYQPTFFQPENPNLQLNSNEINGQSTLPTLNTKNTNHNKKSNNKNRHMNKKKNKKKKN